MLFKRGDRFTLVVKNKTHNGNPNKFTHLRHGIFDKDSKFLVSKNYICFYDTQQKDHRRMHLTNIFSITNITRLNEEQEKQTPTSICRSKTCDNALVGYQSTLNPLYCVDCA